LLRIALWHMGVSELLIARSTVTRLDPLIAGALLAASPRVRALASRFAPAVLLVGCGMLLLFPPAWRTPLYFTNAITFGCLVARASEGKFRWLRSRFLRSFGKYSYAIYMFHYLVLGLLLRLSGRFGPTTFAIVVIVVGTSLSYGLARLSWVCLEHPALRLKRFFPNAHAA
jgi:peptidoglycan/LPS O-acetylase OafA/YrhL